MQPSQLSPVGLLELFQDVIYVILKRTELDKRVYKSLILDDLK